MASRLSSFLSELKRRKVYRVAAVYAAVGVAISMAVPDLFGAFGFPSWAAPLVIVIIGISFPVALVLAWAYEVKPEEPKGAIPNEAEPLASTGTPASSDAPSSSQGLEDQEGKSIAVLPFVDMSPQQDQEYFCDGMAEEIINALTKMENLRVAARTSSFHFKGRAEHVREIGRTLEVNTVLEGSVRRAGNRLRVTAQLVTVEGGYHLWSETYDRELEDVFAIQDEIALAVVDGLKVRLHLNERASMKRRQTSNLDAYEAYLKGLFEWNSMTEEGLARCQELYREATRLDPDFAEEALAAMDPWVSAHRLLCPGIFAGEPKLDALIASAY